MQLAKTGDRGVEAAPIRSRKSGRKQMSLVDGTIWKEGRGVFILNRKDLQASVQCWTCGGQRKVPMTL